MFAIFGGAWGAYGVYSLHRTDLPWLLAVPLAITVIMFLTLGKYQRKVEALPDGFPHLYVLDETALAVRCSVSPQVSTRGSIRYARGTIASPSAVITPDQSRTTRAVSRG